MWQLALLKAYLISHKHKVTTKKNFWLTEKLVQCFLVGTIPLYYGTEFNEKISFSDKYGVYSFRDLKDLDNLLPNMDEYFYSFEKNQRNISMNFDIAKRYTVCEDHIFEKILKSYVT